MTSELREKNCSKTSVQLSGDFNPIPPGPGGGGGAEVGCYIKH